ncbi:MAG: hypothetical protein V4687_09390 [Bacteroidota bacterium]
MSIPITLAESETDQLAITKEQLEQERSLREMKKTAKLFKDFGISLGDIAEASGLSLEVVEKL